MRLGQRIEVETIDTGLSLPTKRRPFKAQWARFPLRWFEALQRSKSASTYQLALVILFEGFKREQVGGEIVLSMEVTKMPSTTRIRATKELVRLGLIEVSRHGRQAARVIKLYL
jgi:hypothetical protein